MKKVTMQKLVSLILEEIKKTDLPDEPIFFKDPTDAIAFIDRFMDSEPKQSEVAEMANVTYTSRKLDQPLRIPVADLSRESRNVPKVISKDPETGEMVEGVIIGDEIRTYPQAPEFEFLAFVNYAVPQGPIDKKQYMTHLVYIPENTYYKLSQIPRTKKFGTEYTGSPLYTAPEGETKKGREERLEKLSRQKEGYSKRYVLHNALNKFFSRRDILDRLDTSLIPEIWGSPLRTERVTNEEQKMKFGGNGWAINAEYYSVKDITNVEEAIDEIMRVRMDLEGGVTNRERRRSETKPREYSDYIYRHGGRWQAIQRIFDENRFKSEGEYTRILKLLKKNIQKGEKAFNTFSKLIIEGDKTDGDIYRMRAKFTVQLNVRPEKVNERGQEVSDIGKTVDDIIRPIFSSIDIDIPDEYLDDPEFNARKYPEFFFMAIARLLSELGGKILTEINPDEVLGKIIELVTPEGIENPVMGIEI